MSQKTYSLTAGVIFLLIALGPVSRIVFRWPALIAGWPVPFWVSWVVMLVTGYMAYAGFRLAGKSQ